VEHRSKSRARDERLHHIDGRRIGELAGFLARELRILCGVLAGCATHASARDGVPPAILPARSIAADIEEWVADEVQLQSFTGDLGFVVYPVDGFIMMANQQLQAQTHWRVTISMATGLLGGLKTIVNHGAIEKPDPPEQQVRDKVAALIEELRQHRTKIKAPSNGHGKHFEVKGRG
jgi:hypothetical protein